MWVMTVTCSEAEDGDVASLHHLTAGFPPPLSRQPGLSRHQDVLQITRSDLSSLLSPRLTHLDKSDLNEGRYEGQGPGLEDLTPPALHRHVLPQLRRERGDD